MLKLLKASSIFSVKNYIDNKQRHIESNEYCEILNPEKINLEPEVHPLILIPVFYKPTLLC